MSSSPSTPPSESNSVAPQGNSSLPSGGYDGGNERPSSNTNPFATMVPTPLHLSGSSKVTNEMLDCMSELATAALTSPDREVRDNAAHQLLFLSSYEYWETLRTLLPRVSNNHLRFLIAKAFHFLVSNELGPMERTEVQQYVLEYIRERRMSGEVLPVYLRNTLFSVFASALFSNWKIAIIRSESSELVDSADMAQDIFAKMNEYLNTEETLDCVLEVLTYFARQNAKHSILSVKGSFAKQVLPFFFSAAADMLATAPEKAALVCSNALECAPELEAPQIRIHHPSDPSITVLRWPAWSSALSVAMYQCGMALLEQPDGPAAAIMARLLRQCSTVTSPQEEYIATRDEVAAVLLDVSSQLLYKMQEQPERTELLRLAAAVLVNTFERNDEVTVVFLAHHVELIHIWVEATRYILAKPFDTEEADLYQSLLHLFYLIAERLLPPKPRLHRSLEDSFDGFFPGASTPPRTPGDREQECRTPPPSAPRGPLSGEQTRAVEQAVMEVFTTYLDLIMDTAHQREESQELRSAATFVLQTERFLQPIAEVLFCERIDLLPVIVDRLHRTIYQYEMCVRTRAEQAAMRANNSSGEGSGYGGTAQSLLQELYMTMAVDSMSVTAAAPPPTLDPSVTPLFYTHVSLSRLSVLLSIFALAMLQGTANNDTTVLATIANFARQLLGQEDQITEDLLQCLSLLDDDNGGVGFMAGSVPRPTASGQMQVHMGILRALFFFCGRVYETSLSRNEVFYEITVNLLCYVYRHHSDLVPLVSDANLLLSRIVDYGSSGTYFLGAEKLLSLIEAVREDQIQLLRAPAELGMLGKSTEAMEARHGLLTAITFYAETRYYAGFPINEVVEVITERCFDDAHLRGNTSLAFQDLQAITEGVHQPDTLYVVVDTFLRHKEVYAEVVRYEARAAPQMISWLAVLCSRSAQYMDDQILSTTPWELISRVMNVVCLFFSFLSYPTPTTPPVMYGVSPQPARVNGRSSSSSTYDGNAPRHSGATMAPFFNFPTDAVEPPVLYDISDLVHILCTAPWSNLSFVYFYERPALEHFFCGAVELLTSTSVYHIMSDDRRRRVFNAIMSAVSPTGDTFQQLHLLCMRQGVWNRLVRQVARCLSYAYATELVDVLFFVLQNDQQACRSIPQYTGVDIATLADTFNEICTLIAVAPHLAHREMGRCFRLLQMCYDRAPLRCGECADRLLDFCSAYHRVRLRLIINALRRGDGEQLLAQYMTYFGQTSSVGVLSAW